MCGICGVITGTISHGEKDLFLQLLFLSSFRGMDSTGVFGIHKLREKDKNEVTYLKGIGNPLSFIQENGVTFNKDIWRTDTQAIIGHTRYATKGKVTEENAHPFDFPNIIGVHNGQVTPSQVKTEKEYETDSEALYAYISENGLEAALGELFRGDAYTLVFFDKKKRTLNAIRNDKRPLSLVPIANGSTIFLASESGFLRFILDREGTKYKEIYTLKPGQLISFDMTSSNPARDFEVTEVEIEKKSYKTVTWPKEKDTSTHNFKVKDSRAWKPEVHVNEMGLNTGPTQKRDYDFWNKKVVTPQKYYQIYNRGYTPEEYQEKLEKGCVWCTSQCDKEDKTIEWLNQFDYLCGTCKGYPEVQEYKPFYAANNPVG